MKILMFGWKTPHGCIESGILHCWGETAFSAGGMRVSLGDDCARFTRALGVLDWRRGTCCFFDGGAGGVLVYVGWD